MASGDNDKKKFECAPRNPCFLIRKLVELIEHPISKHAVDRHLLILNQFLNATHYAFWLHDIPFIIKLYENIVQKLDQIPELKKPLECLLYYSSVPPMMTKASHKLEYGRDLQEYFSVLGYMILCLHDSDLKTLVLNAIQGLLKPKPPIGYCCIPLENCREAAEQSRLPEILAQLIQVLNNDIYPQLLSVIFLTCQISKFTCQKMLQENAIEYLLQRFEPTWHERSSDTKPKNPSPNDDIPIFEDTCCILWKLLNSIEVETINVENPSPFALWSLQYALRWSLTRCGQRFNRNNLTAIILKILTVFPTMDFTKSDLFDDIIILASAAADCKCYTNIEFRDDETDFQFKKIIWACLHFIDFAEVKDEFIKSLTKILYNEEAIAKKCKEQYCDFVKIILKIIPKLLPGSFNAFLQINGPQTIINAIEGYLSKNYEIEVLEACIYCLSKISMMETEDILTILNENNASNILIALCNKILESETLTSVHQKILARGFCILQIICAAKYVINNEIINMCVMYLNRVIRPTDNDSFTDVRTTICAVHLIWECTLATKSLFNEFLKKGGIYVMLDVTEACTLPIKSLTLGVLADASKKSASVPYLITWRKRGKRLLPILMEIFRDRTEKICDVKNVPLLDKENKSINEWIALCNKQKIRFQPDCISKDELLNNCRNKIHSIVYALKIKFKKQVEIANEHYKLFNKKLDTEDEVKKIYTIPTVTMIFAENFFSLKMCDSWTNIAKDLKIENINPINEDNDHLKEKIQMIKQWKSYLRAKIDEIFLKDLQKEHFIELETYTVLKDARLSDALDALKELRFITNCTERMFQMRQKLRLQREVDLVVAQNSNFHRTISELPFTNLFNQTISIQSNIIYEKKEDPCPITPVSSCDSKTFIEDSISVVSLEEHQLEC